MTSIFIGNPFQKIKDKIIAQTYHDIHTDYTCGGEQSFAFEVTTVDYPQLLADIEELEQFFAAKIAALKEAK